MNDTYGPLTNSIFKELTIVDWTYIDLQAKKNKLFIIFPLYNAIIILLKIQTIWILQITGKSVKVP